jgi:hypothetical protein
VQAQPTTPSTKMVVAQAAALAIAGVAGVLVLRTFDPVANSGLFPQCPFHAMTGGWCIGCGMTRAMHALAHLDLPRAFAMNPLMVLLLLLSPAMLAWHWGWRPRALAPLMRLLGEPKFWLVLLPTYMLLRNLPWWPFTLLAPG